MVASPEKSQRHQGKSQGPLEFIAEVNPPWQSQYEYDVPAPTQSTVYQPLSILRAPIDLKCIHCFTVSLVVFLMWSPQNGR